MKDVILVVNAGSSSLKISIFEVQDKKIKNKIYNIFLEKNDNKIVFHINKQQQSASDISGDPISLMINLFIKWWEKQENLKLIATGHRVVHGGKYFQNAVSVTEQITKQLEKLVPLSPLHQPYNLQVLNLFYQKYSNIPHIACFDTSFHTTNPPVARAFGLPKKYYDQGIIRYGFHGLSYKYVSTSFKKITTRDLPERTIIAHLGSGSSVCALKSGKSIASSMGFSVLDGLMMGTRTGALDPGVVLYFLEHEKMSVKEITNLLYRESGLLGVSGKSADMRVLLDSNESDAKFAIELFVYRIQLEIGKLASALEGFDCLIFTAGVGENSAIIRQMITDKLAWLGIKLDDAKNQKNNHIVSADDSKIKVFALPTNEELVIAEEVLELL